MSLHFAPKEKVYFVLNSNGVVLTWSVLKEQCIQYIESHGGSYNES
jgi:hypothetical protein